MRAPPLPLPAAPQGAWLPLHAAAAALGVSLDTIQRRRKRGELPCRQEATASGFRWLVQVAGAAPAAVPPLQAAPATLPPHPLEQQRAAALAAYGATLLAPVLAELGAAREQLAAQAETIGTLRAQLAQAQRPPWWRRWWPFAG